ncbi:general secretion pathway protein GspK [Sulfurimonas sp. SWIR-19]|uniref:general secretion pathway protein GspK n=1 Tax=Sulfurimonas sp. SWIR-19 TaxID=2878390 RepID=UPI001CF2E0E1|nr:type II secretion system protein GspK [Sulfurimonas sp. SWIR-19]UCN00591.1 general secretion pathway protein GspK [Sulfurimonas sp. SWIR-19]
MITKRGGFALAIVLWIVAALLVGVAYLSTLSRDTVQLSYNLKDKLNSKIIAQNYLEALKFYILTGNYDNRSIINNIKTLQLPSRFIVDGRAYKVKNARIRLQDASGMINVFYPDAQLVAKMATDSSQRELFYSIKDSVKDWIDTDNNVRLNGAEQAYYQLKKDLQYQPGNITVLQSISELHLIKGVRDLSKQQWNQLKKTLYAQSNGAMVNLTLVNKKYLISLLKLNPLEADTLLQYKEKDLQKFIKLVMQNKNYNDESMGFYLSYIIKIEITVKINKAKTKIMTMINFRPHSKQAYKTLFYKVY